MKKKKNGKKSGKIRHSGAVRVFQGFATILFVILTFLLTLSFCTSPKSLVSLCNKYVRSVTLNEDYFGNYEEAGFTEEETQNLLTDDGMYNIMSNVMSDRMLALFRYTDSYETSLDDCKEKIRGILEKYNENGAVSESKISTLTDYTCDISGISAMFVYDTPLAYRESLFDTSGTENVITDTKILEGISRLSSWYFLLTVGLMYLFVLIILFFIKSREEAGDMHTVIANTSLYPAFMLLGISIGELLGIQDTPIVTDFVFTHLLIVCIVGILWGILNYFGIRKVLKRTF